MLHSSTRVRILPSTDAQVRARSRGAISRNPVAGDLAPARHRGVSAHPGGLYDETIFGPLAAPHADAFGLLELGFESPHPAHGQLVRVVAVLPAALRPHDSERGQELTWAYASLYGHAARAVRLAELEAPARVVDAERERVSRALAAVVDNRFAPVPVVVGAEKRGRASLVDLLDAPHQLSLATLEVVLFAMGWTLAPA